MSTETSPGDHQNDITVELQLRFFKLDLVHFTFSSMHKQYKNLPPKKDQRKA